jgi:lipopolysaccharide biosynthesis protein
MTLLDNRLFFVGNLKVKVYKTIPHTLETLRNTTRYQISTISREELQRVNNNAFPGYTEGKCFNISCSSGEFLFQFRRVIITVINV